MDSGRRSPEPWAVTPEEAAVLDRAGERFAAGFLLGAGVSAEMRHARGIAAHLERAPLRPWRGEALMPAGGSIWAPMADEEGRALPPVLDLTASYVAIDLCMNAGLARERAAAAPSAERAAHEKLALFCESWPRGGGYTHSIVHFGRALAEGLDAYAARVLRRMDAEPGAAELYRALLVVIDAIDAYRGRLADQLRTGRRGDAECERRRARLLAALETRLPMRPAGSFFEAMLATSLLYAIDGSDDLGRFDQFMRPYYEADLAADRTTREEALELVGALWQYVDDCTGWNVALGGTTATGGDASSDFTLVCLEAGRGRRRPNLAMRLRRDTPARVWEAVIDTLGTGAGLPALYCEENYLRAIDAAHLNLPLDDRVDFAFGGCTELMIHGCSNVGSLDGDFSVIRSLEQGLPSLLPTCADFEGLMAGFEARLRGEIAALTAAIDRNQEVRAEWHPQLIRSLLIDDCIDAGRSFQAGGARHNWSVVNIVGLSNAIDSLAAVRRTVFEERSLTAERLLAALEADFDGFGAERALLERCPRFGNDDADVNALAGRLSGMIYREFKRYAPWRGGRYLCGTLMFTTYGWFGRPVGATPDGRSAGSPVGDSSGPVQGRDRSGPTAMLRSTAALEQQHAPGTPVVNMRLARGLFRSAEGRTRIRSLIEGYFAMGGMQLQVNVVDQETLRRAMERPEEYADLIVRVGGFSEYFIRLDDQLKRTLLERTEHC